MAEAHKNRPTSPSSLQSNSERSSSPPPICVALLEPMPLLRNALHLLIESRPHLKVGCETGDEAELTKLLRECQPNVLVIHPSTEEISTSLLESVLSEFPKLRIVVLTDSKSMKTHREALFRGVVGLVQKERNGSTLLQAIECVHAGEVWMERAHMADLLESVAYGERGAVSSFETKLGTLSLREREVVELVAEGLRNRHIAEKLFLSETTVRHHLTSVFKKLDVSGRQELIVQFARRQKPTRK